MSLIKPKSIYKIFIIPNKMYFLTGGYTKKSSWHSLYWVVVAAKKAAKQYGKDNIKIHEFPIENVIEHSYDELVDSFIVQKEFVKAKKEKLKVLQEISKAEKEYNDCIEKLKIAKYNLKKYNIDKIVNNI